MDRLASNVQHAVRHIRRHPGRHAAIVVTLAIAIGATTAVYSLFNAVVLRPLPFEHARRLVWIRSVHPEHAEGPFSLPEFLDYRQQAESLDALVAYTTWGATLTARGYAERLEGMRLSADAFTVLGVRPYRGRLLEPSDDQPGAPRVAVLGHDVWRRRFGADDAIVGQTLTLNGDIHVVVGVLPRLFPLPDRDIDIVVPLAPDADPLRGKRQSSVLRFIGRLKPGIEPSAAAHELAGIAARLRQRFPVEYASKIGVRVTPLQEELVGSTRNALTLILAAIVLVLGIACANVANLLLVGSVERRREIAVRIALGAGRATIIGQLLTESALSALGGGLCGMLVSFAALRGVARLALPGVAGVSEPSLGGRVLAFTFFVTLAVALLCGISPAVQAVRLGSGENLLATRASSSSARQKRLRRRLIVAQLAFTVVLLVGSALVTDSLIRLQRVEPGFSPKNVFVARVSLPPSGYARPEQLARFYDRLEERLLRLPGVKGAGIISVAPLSGRRVTTEFTVDGHPPLAPGEMLEAQFRLISPGYLDAVGTRVLLGRHVRETDRGDAPSVALVSQALADRFLGAAPVGQRLLLSDTDAGPRPVEVVGVVQNVKHSALDAAPSYDVYLPWAQARVDYVPFLRNFQFWAVRSAGDPLMLREPFRKELDGIDPSAAAAQGRSLQQYLDSSLAPRRLGTALMGAFALAALGLALVGLYAVMAYEVSQQTREIGIRVALGALPADVYRLVRNRVLSMIVPGVFLGLVASLLGGRAIGSILFGVRPYEPTVLFGVSVAVVAVGLGAAYGPSRRAATVDPVVALRVD